MKGVIREQLGERNTHKNKQTKEQRMGKKKKEIVEKNKNNNSKGKI